MLVFTLGLASLIVYHTIPAEAPPSLFEPVAYYAAVWIGVVVLFVLALVVLEIIAALLWTVMRVILPS
jgi:hypothetical protein